MSPPVGSARAGVVGARAVDVIPDSELDQLYYARTVTSIDPWVDENGTYDAGINGGPTLVSSGINGYKSVDYAGADDYHLANGNAGLGSGDEWTAVIVAEVSTTTIQSALTIGNKNSGYNVQFDNNQYTINHGGSDITTGGSYDGSAVVVVATYDGSTAILEENGTEQINTSLASPSSPVNETVIGGRLDGNDNFENATDGLIGAAGHEAAFADQTRRDELTNDFADAFGITI